MAMAPQHFPGSMAAWRPHGAAHSLWPLPPHVPNGTDSQTAKYSAADRSCQGATGMTSPLPNPAGSERWQRPQMPSHSAPTHAHTCNTPETRHTCAHVHTCYHRHAHARASQWRPSPAVMRTPRGREGGRPVTCSWVLPFLSPWPPACSGGAEGPARPVDPHSKRGGRGWAGQLGKLTRSQGTVHHGPPRPKPSTYRSKTR